MKSRLTLRLDDRLIEVAKRRSAESGRSVSRMVSDYFALIDARDREVEITPRVRSLRGVLGGSELDERDYRRHFEHKYL